MRRRSPLVATRTMRAAIRWRSRVPLSALASREPLPARELQTAGAAVTDGARLAISSLPDVGVALVGVPLVGVGVALLVAIGVSLELVSVALVEVGITLAVVAVGIALVLVDARIPLVE